MPFINLQPFCSSFQVLLHAEGEDMSDLRITVGYVLELAKCDMSYDVRDRARVLKNFLSHCRGLHDLGNVKECTETKDLTRVLTEYIFGGQPEVSSEPFSYRFYLPGSLSQIVLHAAPGYEPLPEPCSLVDDGFDHAVQGTGALGVRATNSNPNEIDSDATSGSMDEENTSDYSSEGSVSSSSHDGSSNNNASDRNFDEESGALIHLSDSAPTSKNHDSNGQSTSSLLEARIFLISAMSRDHWPESQLKILGS